MKKLVTLAVLTIMVLGFAGIASAVELEAKGKFQFQANIIDNSDYLSAENDGVQEDDLNFYFRARAQFRFIANENLMSELYVEYKTRVGASDSDLNSGSTDRQLGIKRMFLQYRFPGTEVLTTAGVFAIELPGAASGNVVLGDIDAGALFVESPITDQIGITAGFIRAYDANSEDGSTTYGVQAATTTKHDEVDLFYAGVPVKIDGIEATPYFMYGLIGKDTYGALGTSSGISGNKGLSTFGTTPFDKDATAWWLGTSFSMDMFDPFVLKADIVYGAIDANKKQNDRSGLLVDASLAYTGFDFVQPKVMFAYSTGEDDNTDNGSERLPSVNNNFAFGTTYFGGSALTSSDFNDQNQLGFWMAGLSFEGISFLDKLTHDLTFLYIKGTNDKDLIKNSAATLTNGVADGNFLTTEDQAFEVDFNTNYQIYDELAAIVEFGYVDVDLDKNTWENYNARNGKDDPLLKLAIGLVYSF
ncbi:outer membrane homotrimeric porin [Maridesulfovibrio zosterae]|uniref:outer membrane homotrimeric porin n=1 Tax=Maridesulfovibrio zosterae TaxID=82171 RepID=UPI0004278790|nr:outer membrane homotrimeric porin [Maridesulfovibrio zosterae]